MPFVADFTSIKVYYFVNEMRNFIALWQQGTLFERTTRGLYGIEESS